MEATLDLTIEELGHELLAEMDQVSENEVDYLVKDNQVTITFKHEDELLPVTVEISFEDTPKSLFESFVEKLAEAIEAKESEERWNASQYEDPRETQGYAFDLLTLR